MKEQKMDNLEKVAGAGSTRNRGEATRFRFSSDGERLDKRDELSRQGFGSEICITPIPCGEHGIIMTRDEEYIFGSPDGSYYVED